MSRAIYRAAMGVLPGGSKGTTSRQSGCAGVFSRSSPAQARRTHRSVELLAGGDVAPAGSGSKSSSVGLSASLLPRIFNGDKKPRKYHKRQGREVITHTPTPTHPHTHTHRAHGLLPCAKEHWVRGTASRASSPRPQLPPMPAVALDSIYIQFSRSASGLT
jgi:hypothetical protein